MNALIVRSSHKNSNKQERNTVFRHFCPEENNEADLYLFSVHVFLNSY